MPSRRQVANTRLAISPRLATRRRWIIWPSHPEDAVALGALPRRVLDHRQADAQDGAGVAGVDDAVVVEHPGQEEREALLLDGLLDELAHAGVGRLVVLLALGLGGGT